MMIMTAETPDKELVSGAQSGDREPMELLLTRHQPWIFNLAVRILRRADAEDATQEVLLKAARARRDLYSYLRGNCSLVNPDAACRCARKTRAFIQGGFVDPVKLNLRRHTSARCGTWPSAGPTSWETRTCRWPRRSIATTPSTSRPSRSPGGARP